MNEDILNLVQLSLAEDLGTGDLTANLIEANSHATAHVISREPATLCGQDWFAMTFTQLASDQSGHVDIKWHAGDGDRIIADQLLCVVKGPTRTLLSAERTALNFLQTLSGTATLARQFADHVADLPVKLLDTRKTIPGLRLAQKYAVRCGGCFNHRKGLYDGLLIKENHIIACGSVKKAIQRARTLTTSLHIEVEVETLEELESALEAGADILLLDNFDLNMLTEAVRLSKGRAQLEASGGVTLETLRAIAETGVDFISIGTLTKDIMAIDLSMRFQLG
jgi:nicotinate-nucleotide pyrophosphorylase (carboxylating)